MTEKHLNRILAVIFLIVGILAVVNTARLHTYIRETLPRDQAQEQCNADTIDTLAFLLEVRFRRDELLNRRDDTGLIIIDKLATGQQPTPQEVTAWRDAVNADNEIRRQALIDIERHPLPDC